MPLYATPGKESCGVLWAWSRLPLRNIVPALWGLQESLPGDKIYS